MCEQNCSYFIQSSSRRTLYRSFRVNFIKNSQNWLSYGELKLKNKIYFLKNGIFGFTSRKKCANKLSIIICTFIIFKSELTFYQFKYFEFGKLLIGLKQNFNDNQNYVFFSYENISTEFLHLQTLMFEHWIFSTFKL